MKKYVIKDGNIFEITISRDRYVVKPEKSIFKEFKKILIEEKQNDFNYLEKEIPVSWIKKEFIRDYEFVDKYHPEYFV